MMARSRRRKKLKRVSKGRDISLSVSTKVSTEEKLQPSIMCNPDNTCSAGIDIPGFYYDAEKKRYFRLLPGNNNNNPLTTDSLKVAEIEKLRTCKTKPRPPRTHCLPVALLNPERGFSSPSTFSSLVQESRMSNFKCVSEVITENLIELSAKKCKYLTGQAEDGILVGAWSSEEEGFIIHSLFLDVDENSDDNDLVMKRGSVVNIHPCNFQLADLCIAEVSPKHHFILYTGTYVNPERESVSTIHLLPIRSECDQSTPENRELLDSKSQNYEFVGKHLWSSCFNNYSKTIFAGGESIVYQFALENAVSTEYSTLNENIFSVTTNGNSQMLYTGSNKGQLVWYDTRSKVTVGHLKIGRGVSYLKVLSDENKIIASSFDDSLVQVDLREKKVIFSYPEHKNQYRKLPFSVDELTKVLCSVGQDRITRLWSLQDGKILASILPPEITGTVPEPWVWYSDHWNIRSKSKMYRSSLVMSAEKMLLLYSPK